MMATFVSWALPLSLFMLVFLLGLKTKLADVAFLRDQPGLLFRSLLAMNILLLILVVVAGQAFQLEPAIKIALVTLAISPVPPLLPNKQIAAGGSPHYAVSLLVTAALAAIVLVPTSLAFLQFVFPFQLRITPRTVISIVTISVLAPLILGILARHYAPSLAAAIEPRLTMVAGGLQIAALIPALIMAWPDLALFFGNGVVLSLIIFSAAGILLGHWLGGPEPGDRTVLALACGTRHPGIATAVASINFPDERGVAALIVYHLVIGGLATGLYIRWRDSVR